MKSYRSRIGLTLGALLLAFASGCSDGPDTTGASSSAEAKASSPAAAVSTDTQTQGTQIKYPLSQSLPTLDPHLSLGGSNATVVLNIYEGLFAFNENYEPVPMLAESFDVSEDGRTYTFKLRQGVKFHNGKEMKAEDVAASLNRWKDTAPRAKSSFGEASFKEDGDYTVVLELKDPKNDIQAQLSHVLNFAAIMPKETIDSALPDGVTEYIGTGPFKFVEWKNDQYVHLAKFDDYRPVSSEASGFSGKKEALVQDVYFTLATDNATRFSSFLAGDFDAVDINSDTLPQVENDPNITLIKDLSSDFNLVFNKKSELFSNVKYRQAVTAALDADQILLAVTSTPDLYRLNPSYMYKENAQWYSEAGSEAYNQKDPDKAKKLLEEAGYAGQTVRLLTTKETGNFYNATLMLQSQLEQIGVKTQIDIYDYATMLTKRGEEGSWDLYLGPFLVPSTPSQLLYLNPTYGFADDAELAKLLQNATSAIGEDKIKQANDELQAYEWEYLAAAKIGDTYKYTAIRSDLKGLTLLGGFPNLANTSVNP
ncbi:ABC transporter substrate-binding protein [Saccharibacillus sp. CPCC 101409]|uniref:ABC transporter substrate-binding protein n=1 Tax=Saccharibacillus sp. CPCC 101409 TaxID=3058041 RepID=UPI002671F56A|nr:ABC transporter substrate-binding protein [Saccharibacillus sp. CPCC 101409]MDO3408250.1 ABC transporter substrate-binding protein [Saccharibacillus sp. CPCC 101409]